MWPMSAVTEPRSSATRRGNDRIGSWPSTACRPVRTRTSRWITSFRSASAGLTTTRTSGPNHAMTIEPEWNAERKDQLEWKLRELVCAGKLDIAAAQQAVADDWIEAWTRFVGTGYANNANNGKD